MEVRSKSGPRPAFSRLVVFALALSACTSPLHVPMEQDPARAVPGMLASIESAGGYPDLVLRAMIWWQGLSEQVPTQYGVSLYRVSYWTTGPDGRLTIASGLVALPRTDSLRGVVSYQHGTASQRKSAPSTPDPGNGIVASAVFAGRGYLLCAPDYIGLGASTEPHPYYHAETAAHSVIDLLRAARPIAEAAGFPWPATLFLVGFSQGGHATLAAQRALEAAPLEGLRVTASAPVSGPYDLAAISIPHALEGRSWASSLYVAYLLSAYARIYGMPLSSVLREPYASEVPGFFDGLHDGKAIAAALPARPREMFREDFLANLDAGRETWVLQRLVENGLHDWSPKAPIRLYYGNRDLDVSPQEAITQAERLRARGGDVRAINVGDVDHDGSVLVAIPDLRAWFDELAAGR